MIFNIKPSPKHGDVRVVKQFAYFPTKCKAKLVWLETYYTLEQFSLFNTRQWDLLSIHLTYPDNVGKKEWK
jgi:hypothetical protein